MTEELDTVAAAKTGLALRLVMVVIALVSLVPAGLTIVLLVVGVGLASIGAGRDLPGADSWLIVVVALLLSVSTCVTAAVAAMSGDRRSTWVGMALFVVMIVPVMVVRFAAAPDVGVRTVG